MIEVTYPLKPKAWSFSSIELYKLCPKKYEAERLTKEVEYTDTVATLYGKEMHTACEDYVNGKPLHPHYSYAKPVLDSILKMKGEKLTELKLGLKYAEGKWVACDFDDADASFRGVADLVVLDGARARVLDYKSSAKKSVKYAKPAQLELMAACIFALYPEVQEIRGALLFLVAGEVISNVYKRENMQSIFDYYHDDLRRREGSYQSGVFNAEPNNLCRMWCSVASCIYNGKYNGR